MPQKWGRDTKVKFLGGEITFKLTGSREADDYVKDLNGMAARGENLEPAMKKILAYLMRSTERNFSAEGRPNRWKPLSKLTIEDRQEQGFAPGIRPEPQDFRKLSHQLMINGNHGLPAVQKDRTVPDQFADIGKGAQGKTPGGRPVFSPIRGYLPVEGTARPASQAGRHINEP